MKTPQPNWTNISGKHGWTKQYVLHYGVDPSKPASRDMYLVAGDSCDPSWCAWNVMDLVDGESSRLWYDEHQSEAMEHAQRCYWGQVYEEVVGYDAHQDDPKRTSIDMITTLAEIIARVKLGIPLLAD